MGALPLTNFQNGIRLSSNAGVPILMPATYSFCNVPNVFATTTDQSPAGAVFRNPVGPVFLNNSTACINSNCGQTFFGNLPNGFSMGQQHCIANQITDSFSLVNFGILNGVPLTTDLSPPVQIRANGVSEDTPFPAFQRSNDPNQRTTTSTSQAGIGVQLEQGQCPTIADVNPQYVARLVEHIHRVERRQRRHSRRNQNAPHHHRHRH